MEQLVWSKCTRNAWYRLVDLDLDGIHGHGVYVIWHGGYPSRVVFVGWGEIGPELNTRRNDPRLWAYLDQGPLYVTWANADASCAGGIARHLADSLRPLISDAFGDVAPVAANGPF